MTGQARHRDIVPQNVNVSARMIVPAKSAEYLHCSQSTLGLTPMSRHWKQPDITKVVFAGLTRPNTQSVPCTHGTGQVGMPGTAKPVFSLCAG
jgi:hypothetical protein